jgi:oxygen-dependent protoporphyrinogen oxidase
MSITIVGGGISGLSLAYFLLERNPSSQIQILEAEQRPGGKIWSDKTAGYLCEGGVNGFLDNKPRTLEFAHKLSLSPLRSNDTARKRFIFSNENLHLLPESPQAFLLSGLLSPFGKGRIFFEIFAPRGDGNDETLASFARRRLGKEAYEKLIDPMASGIYAGDPEKLSLKSCFPRINELEQSYGSLIKALFKLQKEAKKTGKSVGPGPGGTLTSFYDGMESMIYAVREFLGQRLETSKRVAGLEKKKKYVTLYLEDGGSIDTESAILACPAHASSRILKDINGELSELLDGIDYPSLSVICLGFRREDVEYNLKGFGFLVPWSEKRKILGTLWDSSIFPNRAPEGSVLLRAMVGGARASDLALADENTLVSIVLRELKNIMNIDAEPEFHRVYRHERAIPQYNVGHARRMERIDAIMKELDGLYLTGNAYRGIGVNDCIENSYQLAAHLTKK